MRFEGWLFPFLISYLSVKVMGGYGLFRDGLFSQASISVCMINTASKYLDIFDSRLELSWPEKITTRSAKAKSDCL